MTVLGVVLHLQPGFQAVLGSARLNLTLLCGCAGLFGHVSTRSYKQKNTQPGGPGVEKLTIKAVPSEATFISAFVPTTATQTMANTKLTSVNRNKHYRIVQHANSSVDRFTDRAALNQARKEASNNHASAWNDTLQTSVPFV